LFTPLICGQPVTLLPDRLDTADLGAALAAAGPFSFVKLTPGHLDLLTHQLDAEQARTLAGVVIAAGDNFPLSLAERWRKLAGPQGTKVATEYGPTEITIGNSGLVIDELPATEAIPLGAPIPNTQMYVLTKELEPAPIGVAGEVYIAGTGLARGYLGRPDLTAEKFLPNPYGSAGSRLYRTGDLARFLPDGTLETLGRIDNQVKIRGYRIELGEIEARLRQHPHIHDAVTTVREPQPGNKRLTAYVVTPQPLDTATLRAHLAATLPDYMIPAAFITIDQVPLTTNGKVDHRALPTPDLTAFAGAEQYVAPRTPVEEKLAAIWQDVLGLDRVGVEDSFFDLGGDSIRAVQVLAACRKAGLAPAVWMVLQAKTLGELAAMIPSGVEDIPLSPAQRRMLDAGAPDGARTVRLALSGRADADVLDRAVRAVLDRHEALRPGPAGSASIQVLDLRAVPADRREAAIERAVSDARTALAAHPHGGTLRATLVRVDDDKPDELWLTLHTLAADESSWRIVINDLNSAYCNLSSGQPLDLAPIATPWRTWVGQLAEQALAESLPDQAEYWLGRPAAEPLPLDRSEGREYDTYGTAATLTTVLSAERTAVLLDGPAEPAHLLLATLGRVLAEWSERDRVQIDVLSDPRQDPAVGAALARTVGPLTDSHPVFLRLPKDRDPARALRSLGRQLRSVPESGQAYGLLRYLTADTELVAELAELRDSEVAFRFTPDTPEHPAPDADPLVFVPRHIAPTPAPDAPRAHLLELDARVQDERLYLRWTYGESVHDRATVQRLADRQLAELMGLTEESAVREQPAEPRRRPVRQYRTTVSPTAPDPVPALMSRHGIPGASIALIRDGEVASVRSYGTLSVDDPTLVTDDTLFAAGSISKHVTTFAFLRLVSGGLIDLDRDINDYLRSWQVPPGGAPVTARSLLANQAGLEPHPARDDHYYRYEPVPTVLDVLHGRPPAKTPPVRRRDEPGEVFKLSPLNFSVLQQAMTDVTGEPYPDLVRRLVFEPLGMTGGAFDSVFPDTSGRPFARGHRADGTQVPDGFVVHPETAAGGLWTTAGDLARLAVQIRRCYLGRPGALVDAELVRLMLTPQAGRNYGWSTILDDTGGELEFGHGGQATGYQAMTGLRAQSGTGAVLLSNSAAGRELVRHLLATVWSGQQHLAHLWRQAIDEATDRERRADA
ncbi:serine hydrolase, partial [Streptomyces bauhiniae]|uniref:serine hydrolase domain-containing protein n=1 Tax=Streptomyces bauhiniae TaxID=2340725 RepID=UPI00365E8A1E